MSSHFPTVGVFGSYAISQLMASPALSLGIDLLSLQTSAPVSELARCSVATTFGDSVSISQVKTLESARLIFRPSSSVIEFVKAWNAQLENDSDITFSVLVARSPHGQASAWTPTATMAKELPSYSVTPALNLSPIQMISAQRLALDLAKEAEVVGVMEAEIILTGDEISLGRLILGPTPTGVWTIEGSRTSQFEQHLRAILDLPLGDPALLELFAVSATFSGKMNMYRPYLHLMARSPGLKFHQYGPEDSVYSGHVTALGPDLLDLQDCVSHAVEYMSGDIDE